MTTSGETPAGHIGSHSSWSPVYRSSSGLRCSLVLLGSVTGLLFLLVETGRRVTLSSREDTMTLEQLYPFALLACPLVMVAMMWMMMRGSKHQSPSRPESSEDDEVTRLRAEVDQLRAEQRQNTDRQQEAPGHR
jgi:hypothetical protein